MLFLSTVYYDRLKSDARPETGAWRFVRGFLVCRRETLRLEYDKAGRFVYPEAAQAADSKSSAPAKELATA